MSCVVVVVVAGLATPVPRVSFLLSSPTEAFSNSAIVAETTLAVKAAIFGAGRGGAGVFEVGEVCPLIMFPSGSGKPDLAGGLMVVRIREGFGGGSLRSDMAMLYT